MGVELGLVGGEGEYTVNDQGGRGCKFWTAGTSTYSSDPSLKVCCNSSTVLYCTCM